METLKKIVLSSANPENVSLFIKSLVTFAVLFGFDAVVVSESGEYLTNLLVGVGMILTSITGLFGLARKIKLGKWSASPSDGYSND